MLLYGTIRAVKHIPTESVIFNYTGLSEDFPRIGLLPPRVLGASSEYDFDMKFYDYLINNDEIFMEFMKIILLLYEGKDVFLIISEDEWSTILIESLLKVIQQRYGINGAKIDTEEDMLYVEESDFDPGYGLLNLDQDKERYTYIFTAIQERNKNNGGNYL